MSKTLKNILSNDVACKKKHTDVNMHPHNFLSYIGWSPTHFLQNKGLYSKFVYEYDFLRICPTLLT